MPKLTQMLDWRHWLKGLWSAFIQGGCSAVLGSMGLLVGNLAGVDVKPLDYKQMGSVFLGAAVIRLLFFLNKNPFPATVEVSTDTTPPMPVPPPSNP